MKKTNKRKIKKKNNINRMNNIKWKENNIFKYLNMCLL